MKRCLRNVAAVLLIGSASLTTQGNDWPQWRGPQRDGISKEKGLLKEWPKTGPKLLWKIADAGRGYSTPAVVGDRLYLLGNDGLENEFVQALAAANGQRVWSTRLGNVGKPGQQPNLPAARSTPTIEGQFLYVLGSDGDLACLELATGKIRWQKNIRTEFGGKPGTWAYSESPLVDEDRVICAPGGSEATILALSKKTGDVLWKCALPEADEAAYASAIVVETGGVKQYVELLKGGLVGIEAKTGRFLWRYSKPVSRYGANIPTPVTSDGYIYSAAAGTGGGLVRLKVNNGTIQPEQIYFEAKFPTAVGGAVKVGDYLYGTTGRALLCTEFVTGKIKWEEHSVGAASICVAEGRLYLHGENGDVALVEASSDSYREKGRFTPPDQPKRNHEMEQAWAYPVVANGRLYLRDNGTVWSYDVRALD